MLEDTNNSNREEANSQLEESNLLNPSDGVIESSLETKEAEKLPTLTTKDLDFPPNFSVPTPEYVKKSNDKQEVAVQTNYNEGISKIPAVNITNFTLSDIAEPNDSYRGPTVRDKTVKIAETNKDSLQDSLRPSRQSDFMRDQAEGFGMTQQEMGFSQDQPIKSQSVDSNVQVDQRENEPPQVELSRVGPVQTFTENVYESSNPFAASIQEYQQQQFPNENNTASVQTESSRDVLPLPPLLPNVVQQTQTPQATVIPSQGSTPTKQYETSPIGVVKEERPQGRPLSEIIVTKGGKSEAQIARDEMKAEAELAESQRQATTIKNVPISEDIAPMSVGANESRIRSNYNEVSSNPIKQRSPPLWRTSLG